MSDLSTANPPKTWKVKIVDGFIAQDGFVVYVANFTTTSGMKGWVEFEIWKEEI